MCHLIWYKLKMKVCHLRWDEGSTSLVVHVFLSIRCSTGSGCIVRAYTSYPFMDYTYYTR